MIFQFNIGINNYLIDTDKSIEISIPLDFEGPQPNIYDTPTAKSEIFQYGDVIGDTRKGGSCNFQSYNIYTHFNGTHTECIGHITNERISVHDILKDGFITASLVTIEPEPAHATDDTYIPIKNKEDHLITKKILYDKLHGIAPDFLQGLIIRTLPNDDSKKFRKYMQQPAAFFSVEAMEYLLELKIKHLILDLPSVDRAIDEGELTCHHLFWELAQGTHELKGKAPSKKTITEMAYIPKEVKDDTYLLNIQIPDFVADAAPCRLFIYKIEKND